MNGGSPFKHSYAIAANEYMSCSFVGASPFSCSGARSGTLIPVPQGQWELLSSQDWVFNRTVGLKDNWTKKQ